MSTDSPAPNALAATLAAILRDARTDIVHRWLDRIVARVTVEANSIFPTDALLDHVPLLVEGIADYLEQAPGTTDASDAVAAKAMELGALRHAQGFDAYEIFKEHELLTGILFTVMRDALGNVPEEQLVAANVAYCWERVSEATEKIRQTTMMHFLRIASEQVRAREERLRRFNRMVSHELKNRIGAIRGASQLLGEDWLKPDQSAKFVRIIGQNGEALQRVLENLVALSSLDGDARQQRNVLLPQAAQEITRQLRDAAKLGNVRVELDESLPSVEVDAAAVELALSNYVSNAIKYADAAKAERWVRISGSLTVSTAERPGELLVTVTDNGLGVPSGSRNQLFEQFFRAHTGTVTGVEGTGLGLSIVKDTVESLGGRAWAEFPEDGGSVFCFSLPSRRDEDAAAAGTRRPEVGPPLSV
ncbi:MAG: ATP-binding region ATPase domain protein [Gemmatimonadetes bacterium]|nr:ATP-binding region ATPase domain protein [Gemmatimonadota bacterium]